MRFYNLTLICVSLIGFWIGYELIGHGSRERQKEKEAEQELIEQTKRMAEQAIREMMKDYQT